MAELPKDLDEAIAQAKTATQAALEDGYRRLQVEIGIPELKVQPIAEEFLPLFEEAFGDRFKVYFPDAGAAALARRDWGDKPYIIRGLSEPKGQIQPEDQGFLFIEPSSVEVNTLEKMCEEAGDRPTVLLLPKLENVAIIGIGLAGRQLRERFLSTIESCYYIQPSQGYAVFRCYPSPWQVWLETGESYQLISETAAKPVGDDLERLIMQAIGTPEEANPENSQTPLTAPKKPGLMTNMKRFLRALSQ
jgi:hypothetical protein